MKLKFYVIAALVIGSMNARSQDIHFSQYYASPLTLNPALTGKFDGFARVDAIFRSQYYGMNPSGSLFTTFAGSVDFSLLKDLMKGNALGVGITALDDIQHASGGDITTTTVSLDLGYTLNLDKMKKYQLSVGLEPSLTSRKVTGNYEYPQAFNADLSYDPSSPNNETTSPGSKLYFNFDYGVFFNMKPIDIMTFYLGFSMKNVAQPQTSVVSDAPAGPDGKLPFLYVVHGGFEFTVAKKWTLIPGFLYQTEAKANEANTGLTVGYDVMDKFKNGIRQKATIYVGLWDRMGNDVGSAFQERNITPKIGMDYRNFRVDFAYDFGLGNMASDAHNTPYIDRPMAFELALSYIFGGPKPLKEREVLFNPRY